MVMAAEMFAFADETQPQLKQKLPTVLVWPWAIGIVEERLLRHRPRSEMRSAGATTRVAAAVGDRVYARDGQERTRRPH